MSVLHGASYVAISGGNLVAAAPGSSVTINHQSQSGPSSAFKALSGAAAHTALHDSAARFGAPRCHRNTRAKYRDRLKLWVLGQAEEFERKQLLWLHGGAGAGKSAIMQSVVEECAQHGSVLGSFFFSRADSTRNCTEALIPTLAYQVAHAFPEAMAVLDPFLQRNPLIFKASLHTQVIGLLVRPLRYLFENQIIDNTTQLRRVFLIDGLDECADPRKQALIIQIVASLLRDHHLPICFLIASRPEIAISSAFEREKMLHGTFSTITLDNDDDAKADIRQYIEDSFLDVLDSHPWKMHIGLPWPNPDSVRHLVRKSSGHFMYAATIMRFIASSDEHPGRALKVVEGLEPSRTGSPFAELDALYMHILTSATHAEQVLEILRYCYLSSFVGRTASNACYIHRITPQDLSLFLSGVQSLISLAPNSIGQLCIAPRHATLGDFLKDQARSQGLYMSKEDYHASFLPRYFRLLDDGTPKLTSSLHFSVWNQDLQNLLESLCYALQCSKDTKLLQSLVSRHSPYKIWNFYMESVVPDRTMSAYDIRCVATTLIRDYIHVLRDSVALRDDALYSHQLKMYMELVLDDINDLVHKKPQYCVIPALVFSSGPSGLLLAEKLMAWNEFRIMDFCPSCVFRPLQTKFDGHHRKIDPRAVKAIERMPQSRVSWSSNLAIFMKLVLQNLVHLLGPSPSILRTSPHKQWLQQHKGLKHMSLGSPRMPSAMSRCVTEVWKDGTHYTGKTLYFRLSCWRRLLDFLLSKMNAQINKCRLLLKTIIFYLHKSDCKNDIVMLARRSLPMIALWFPKLMKRARAEMDAYVRRWEESPEGLIEMTKSLKINGVD